MKSMLLLLIFCSFHVSLSSGDEYHIIPSQNDQCIGKVCQNNTTLSTFTATFSTFLQPETTLILHSGIHKLDLDLSISRISSFHVFPHSSSSRVNVICTNSAKLAFYYTDLVNISGVDFIGCSKNRIKSVKQFILTDSSFSGQTGISGTALEITESSANIIGSGFYSNHGSKMLHSVKCQSSMEYKWRRIHTKRVQATAAGGAIFSKRSRISISQCKFEGNRAHVGGAIFCQYHSHIMISDSTFEGNHATSLDKYDNGMCLGGGGVMHIESDSSVTIQKCHFRQNSAHYFGGTIDILHAHNAVLTIDDSTFIDNSAKYGGVLNVFGTYSTRINITNSEFKDNNVKRDGGAMALLSNIYFWSAYAIKMNIVDSKFTENKAQDQGGVVAVSNTENSIVSITKSEFVNNCAQKGGGVMSAKQNDKINITIYESTLNYNEANKGGALLFYLNHRYINLVVYANKFQGNVALSKGGTFYIEGQNLRIKVDESSFSDCRTESGGAMFLYRGETVIDNSNFTNCSASSDGGCVYLIEGDVHILRSTFDSNRAGKNGGSVCSEGGKIFINHTSFVDNSATSGGTLHSQHTHTVITESEFRGSRAYTSGGTMYLDRGETSIMGTAVCDSIAKSGGVIRSHQSDLFISKSEIFNNRAKGEGGVFKIEQGTMAIEQTSFTNNRAHLGAVIWADHATVVSNTVNITDNHANSSIVYHMESTSNWSSVAFTSNTGSLCAVESIVTLRDIVMTDMLPTNRCRRSNLLEEGGAITTFQGMITFYGLSTLMRNNASTGGAINAIEAKLYIHGNVTVVNNSAMGDGGGVYLRQSVLTCQRNSTLMLMGNKAVKKGGGIHAIGSSIKINGTLVERNCASLQFVGNDAEKGGGLHLEMDAKLYILKSKPYTEKYKIVIFTANSADHGGAMYVSDDGMCTRVARRECFFQSLALYNALPNDSVHQSVHFSNNIALSGQNLYGGLLDRCIINPLAEIDIIHLDGNNDSILSNNSDSLTMKGSNYLHMMSNIKNSEIGSPPIRVCFCKDGQPDCTYQPDPIFIRKGHLNNVTLSLAVLDQINRPLEKAKIYNRLSSGLDLCQHHIHSTDGNCSLLNFAAFSNNETEELILFTDGPCKDVPDCQCKVKLEVFCPHCPVGFELKDGEEGCQCDCDSKLKPFISECSLLNQTIMRKKNCWITNITTVENTNSSDYQYLIYPHCPLDYCHPASAGLAINLNIPNGSDTQCANGRSGLMCGECQPGFSLSLGSSRCIPCSSHWPAKLAAIVVAAFIAGILLVVLILVLNLTVAVGSLNGIIFYANIVAANSNIFFPFSRPNFATAFISWFNLEIGFDICFFEGLNSFWKTLLQLVFPTYIFLLVIIVIIFSEISTKFSKLIAKRNPVATLATLVLISYAKFLHTIIASLSFAVLHYPDGSRRVVWLPNASVDYLQGKHIALFIIAVLILIVALLYTFLLFSWQWLLRHKHRKLFKWMRYQKLCHFIEPYHAPYTVRHRYWTGLLLFVRVFLYIISAINISGDPRVSLVTIISVVTTLQLIKGTFAKNLYKAIAVDIVETIMFFNLVIFSTATLYTFDTTENQIAIAYTSVLITVVVFLAILTFHIYKYAGLHLLCRKSKSFRVASSKISVYYKRRSRHGDSIRGSQFAEDTLPRLHPTRSVLEIPPPED